MAGIPPAPIQLVHWRLVGHAACVSASATPRRAEAGAHILQPRTTDMQPPCVSAVKLASVVDQGLDLEVPYLPEAGFLPAYNNNYRRKMGASPPPDEEPSMEQFSARKLLIASSSPPRADFPAYGPRPSRIRKRVRLSEEWAKSYKVLATALIMLDQFSPARLSAYQAHIEKLALRYSGACWPAVYQSDFRRRLEYMQCIGRRELEILSDNPAAALRAGFDAEMPWEFVRKEAAGDGEFWLK